MRAWIATYGVALLSVFLVAAGVGGAVLGGYGAVDSQLGLCGQPVIGVTPPDDTGYVSASGTIGPAFPELSYDALSGPEQDAFQQALKNPNHNGEIVGGTFEHEATFRDAGLVNYEGEEYYVTTESMDRCVSVNRFVFPLGLAGMLVGAATYLLPSLRRRRASDPDSGVLGAARMGRYADVGAFVAFGVGIVLAVIPVLLAAVVSIPVEWLVLVGALLGGAVVGLASSSLRRALVLGGYLGVIVVLISAGLRWWFTVSIHPFVGSSITSLPHVVVVVGLIAAGAVASRALT